MKLRYLVCALLISSAAGPAAADLLILVHGYQSDAGTWVRSGVVNTLEQTGWTPGGLLTPSGPLPTAAGMGNNTVWLAQLPSEAPLSVQAGILLTGVQSLHRKWPDQPIVLVGHSAGGVVARMALVLARPALPDTMLITIASPHLGTIRAAQALEATRLPFPVSWMADVLGGLHYQSLKRSWPLLTELAMAPGSALDWLNHQPHPQAHYVSIIRGTSTGRVGDALVQGYSQDLNQVPSLRGRARIVVVPGAHDLGPMDGSVLLGILASS